MYFWIDITMLLFVQWIHFQCPLQKLKMISNQKKGKGFIIDTRWPFRLHVHASSNINKNCSITFHFGESGHYLFETKVDVNNSLCCAMVIIKKPKNSFIRKYVQLILKLVLSGNQRKTGSCVCWHISGQGKDALLVKQK